MNVRQATPTETPGQSTLSFFLIKTDMASLGNKQSAPTATNPRTVTKESPQSTPGQETLMTKKSQNLTAVAANRWKSTSLASDWLVLNTDNAYCITCLICFLLQNLRQSFERNGLVPIACAVKEINLSPQCHTTKAEEKLNINYRLLMVHTRGVRCQA